MSHLSEVQDAGSVHSFRHHRLEIVDKGNRPLLK